jgi:putative flippase GtrA
MTRFARFLIAGGVGFLADAGMLTVLVHLFSMNPFLARILSIGFALSVTWLLNRTMTFGPSIRSIAAEGARYGSVGIGTSLVNYAVYSALIAAIPALPPLVALVAGSAVAMALSYLGYSRLVFGR